MTSGDELAAFHASLNLGEHILVKFIGSVQAQALSSILISFARFWMILLLTPIGKLRRRPPKVVVDQEISKSPTEELPLSFLLEFDASTLVWSAGLRLLHHRALRTLAPSILS